MRFSASLKGGKLPNKNLHLWKIWGVDKMEKNKMEKKYLIKRESGIYDLYWSEETQGWERIDRAQFYTKEQLPDFFLRYGLRKLGENPENWCYEPMCQFYRPVEIILATGE